MKRISWAWLALALFSCTSAPRAPDSPAGSLPKACQTACLSPFGQKLGVSPEGVAAFSNCQASCVANSPSVSEGQYAGMQWQCVEFVRRWLMKVRGLTFPSIDWASDLWKLDSFRRMDTGEPVPVITFTNGALSLPHPGDVLVYGREYQGTGHMAVVLEVDLQKKSMKVAEENYSNTEWPGNYARRISFVKEDGRFWLLDAYLLGWKALP